MFAGALAWATSTQLNYALVPWQCFNRVYPIPWLAALLAAIALAGAAVSLRTWRSAAPPHAGVNLAAGGGTLSGVLFAAVILLQLMASLIFTGCER